LDAGFTSVMVDGSKLPLQANIDLTAAVAELAHAAGASCEGEIGLVGYAGGAASARTVPDEAARFALETGVDAMAISIGNVHLQQDAGQGLDLDRLRAIEALTPVPLVIHGGSGVPTAERAALAATSNICKFNIGTELRMVFGTALRAALARDPSQFDRIEILRATEAPMTAAAQAVIRNLGAHGQAEAAR
jgi:fructose-bisphosphate aldolase class II